MNLIPPDEAEVPHMLGVKFHETRSSPFEAINQTQMEKLRRRHWLTSETETPRGARNATASTDASMILFSGEVLRY